MEGLYLLDEPESALSPRRQLELRDLIGRAASRGEMTEQEATAELLKVARLTPASAAAMINDWRGAVDGYEEFGCLMVKWTAEGARRATEANAAR